MVGDTNCSLCMPFLPGYPAGRGDNAGVSDEKQQGLSGRAFGDEHAHLSLGRVRAAIALR
jgi:hypothetical protein